MRARARGFGQHVGAAGGEVLVGVLEADRRQVLAAQRHDRGVLAVLERREPALGGLDPVGGAEHQEPRDRPQGRELLDRLVRRPVLAEPDRIVRADQDHALVHQRREADRRAAIIGKYQEGAAIRDQAPVHGHAVHGRHHAVLADAIIDVAAREVAALDRLHRLGLGVVGVGEIGRAADHLGHQRGQHLERLLARLARRPGRLLRAHFPLVRVDRLGEPARQLAVVRLLEGGAALCRQPL